MATNSLWDKSFWGGGRGFCGGAMGLAYVYGN